MFDDKWEKPPKRKSLSVDLTFNRTFSIKPDKKVVSITTMNGRLKNIPYLGWGKHYEYLQRGRIGDAVLVYDKANKEFFLHIPVEIEVEKQTPQEVIGIDVGEVNTVALVSSRGNKEIVPRTEEYKKVKEKYQRLRQALQSKGTRSAKRKLKKVAGREKRFVESFMHYVSKYLVSNFECKNCGYKEHADIVGATNMMIRGLVEVQEQYQGLFVNQPNALPHGMEQAPTSLSGSS